MLFVRRIFKPAEADERRAAAVADNGHQREAEPEEKIFALIYTHLSIIRETVLRNGSLRADFFKDIYEVEHARQRVDLWETDRLTEIIQQGINDGIFNCKDARLTATILFYSLKGMEQSYFRDRVSKMVDSNREEIVRVLFTGLCK